MRLRVLDADLRVKGRKPYGTTAQVAIQQATVAAWNVYVVLRDVGAMGVVGGRCWSIVGSYVVFGQSQTLEKPLVEGGVDMTPSFRLSLSSKLSSSSFARGSATISSFAFLILSFYINSSIIASPSTRSPFTSVLINSIEDRPKGPHIEFSYQHGSTLRSYHQPLDSSITL